MDLKIVVSLKEKLFMVAIMRIRSQSVPVGMVLNEEVRKMLTNNSASRITRFMYFGWNVKSSWFNVRL